MPGMLGQEGGSWGCHHVSALRARARGISPLVGKPASAFMVPECDIVLLILSNNTATRTKMTDPIQTDTIQIVLILINLGALVVLFWTLLIFRRDVTLRMRPWVGITTIEFDADPQHPSIYILVTNTGNLPAIATSFNVQLVPQIQDQSSISHTQKNMTLFPSEPAALGYDDEKLPGLKSLVSSGSKFEVRGVIEYSYGKNKYETKVLAHCSHIENEKPDKDGVVKGHVEWDNLSAK